MSNTTPIKRNRTLNEDMGRIILYYSDKHGRLKDKDLQEMADTVKKDLGVEVSVHFAKTLAKLFGIHYKGKRGLKIPVTTQLLTLIERVNQLEIEVDQLGRKLQQIK